MNNDANSEQTKPHEHGRRRRTFSGPLNVLGKPLVPCGCELCGCCESENTLEQPNRYLCGRVTKEFKSFVEDQHALLEGSPASGIAFKSERDEDQICIDELRCLSVGLWYNAYKLGCAPPVILESTHEDVLIDISVDVLSAIAEYSTLYD
ncbi:MAG: DUF2237 family protein [Pseudomonadota bacterium]